MPSVRALSSLVLVGALSVGCGGDSPTSPSRQEITLVSSQPLSGATITTGCPASTRFICTDQLALAFDVRFDRTIQEAWLNVEFRTDTGQRCAGATSRIAPLVSRVESRATTRITLLSTLPDVDTPLCALPATTTHIVATLVDGSSAPNAVLLTRSFSATYTFGHPGEWDY
jgi:hypothetical protein